MRKFNLKRIEDESGISGTGIVAEGVQFDNGWCVMNWLTIEHEKSGLCSLGIYPDIEHLEKIHGHGGKTAIDWQDA